MALRPVPEGVHEPREAPVNLSGSRLETHADRSPAGASCCYSLLLDPHATMTLTCTNGCSRWSPHEENSPGFFLSGMRSNRLSYRPVGAFHLVVSLSVSLL